MKVSKETHVKAQVLFEDFWEMHHDDAKLDRLMSKLAQETGHTVDEIEIALTQPEPIS